MTDFIGDRPGWDAHMATVVTLEIDLETWANSGRDKHTDPLDQAAFLAQAIATYLAHLEQAIDVAIHEVRLVKTSDSATVDAIMTFPVDNLPTAV